MQVEEDESSSERPPDTLEEEEEYEKQQEELRKEEEKSSHSKWIFLIICDAVFKWNLKVDDVMSGRHVYNFDVSNFLSVLPIVSVSLPCVYSVEVANT